MIDPVGRRVQHHARVSDGWRITSHDGGALTLDGIGVVLDHAALFVDLERVPR